MHKIAFIQSCWHKSIVDAARVGFTDRFQELEQGRAEIAFFEVPGVVEIPLLAQRCARTGRYHAIVVAGLIADHGIYRHEFVAQSVLDGVMQVQLDTGVPVIYTVLTPQDFVSEGREAFFQAHFVVKGVEAADACARMLAALDSVAA